MVEAAWGLKHRCLYCGVLFYDLRKAEPKCPACHNTHDIKAAVKLKPRPDKTKDGVPEDIESEDSETDSDVANEDSEDIVEDIDSEVGGEELWISTKDKDEDADSL